MPVHGQIVGYCSYTAVNKVDSLFPNKVELIDYSSFHHICYCYPYIRMLAWEIYAIEF